MTKLRISSFVIFKMIQKCDAIFVQSADILELFTAHEYANPYEQLRAILAYIDSIDGLAQVYAEFDGSRHVFVIDRVDLEPDEEIIDCVITPWAEEVTEEYENIEPIDCLIEFMKYMMEEADCKEDLYHCWNYGEFSSIQHEWPDCPPEAFYFSDTELFAAC